MLPVIIVEHSETGEDEDARGYDEQECTTRKKKRGKEYNNGLLHSFDSYSKEKPF